MQIGELHFGDKITVLGTFSEYIPFVDPKFILKEAKKTTLENWKKQLEGKTVACMRSQRTARLHFRCVTFYKKATLKGWSEESIESPRAARNTWK